LITINEKFKKIPCKIIKSTDDIQAELQLLLANSTARELTDYEKTYQAGRLQELLQDLKKSGYQFTGRKREIVAQLMNVSSAQVQRMDSINKKLIPELKEEFKDGNMNITAAYEMSRLPEEQQEETLEESAAENKPITPSVAKEKREQVIESEQKEKPITHEISLQDNFFEAIEKGIKTFVHCFNAWEYRENDKLKINEVNDLEWTGRYIEARITYILPLENEFVVMSIKRIR
ncbi:MAG: DUF3850 domain-containing protein, partial [Carnobacterium sp.]|uniref:DUF3850 domain-containing protein n=1 Tax=Carnobacterium sp. TaxID=48221 RepID=UPI002FCADDBF